MKNIIWDDESDVSKNPETTGEDVKSWPIGKKPAEKEGSDSHTDTPASTIRYGESANRDTQLLREKINASTVTLGGGKLFRFNTPTGLQRVGFAVSGMTDAEAEGLCGKYEVLCDDSAVGFLDFDRAFRVNDQWVFSFKLPYDAENAVSVYDMVHNGSSGPTLAGDQLLARMVQILINHQGRSTERDYQPLLCISPHTVYLLRTPRGQISVRILPLILSGNFPSQVPNDSHPDVSTDVYSACYLTCEVLSGGFAAEGVTIREPSDLIRKAMSPFPGWRPGLKAFAQDLELDHVGPVITNKAKRPAGDDSSDGERQGIIKGLSQMFSDLFTPFPADKSDRYDSTWRDEE